MQTIWKTWVWMHLLSDIPSECAIFIILPHSSFSAEVDPPVGKRQLCGGSKPAIERMLEFGRELYNMSLHLRQEQGNNEANKKMLQVSVLPTSCFMLFP